MKSIIFQIHVWSHGTDPAGRAKHSANAAFISAPIPATPYSQTLPAMRRQSVRPWDKDE